MSIKPFKLERYFARYEFNVKYLLSASDCEALSMEELLQMASEESLKLWQNLKLSYTESQGHPLLREEIARLYEHIKPEQVITAAPEEAIYITMHTLLSPGDHVIAISPAYQSLYEVARSMGCDITPWELKTAMGGWQIDINQLEKSITNRTRLLVINFPHNPTGFLPSKQEFEKIIEIAGRHKIHIFSDEMYRLLEYDAADRLPSVCDVYEQGITLSGVSKSFALPGLRLGWLATQESAWIERWLTYKDYTTICSSAPGEILGIIALQAKETIVNRNLAIVRKNLLHAEKFFSIWHQYFDWITPKGGSIAFPCWTGEKTIDQFCQQVLEQYGVMIVPSSIFDYPGNHFRIGLGRENFSEALSLVAEFMNEQNGAHKPT